MFDETKVLQNQESWTSTLDQHYGLTEAESEKVGAVLEDISPLLLKTNPENHITDETIVKFQELVKQYPGAVKFMQDMLDGVFGDPDDPTPQKTKQVIQTLLSEVNLTLDAQEYLEKSLTHTPKEHLVETAQLVTGLMNEFFRTDPDKAFFWFVVLVKLSETFPSFPFDEIKHKIYNLDTDNVSYKSFEDKLYGLESWASHSHWLTDNRVVQCKNLYNWHGQCTQYTAKQYEEIQVA